MLQNICLNTKASHLVCLSDATTATEANSLVIPINACIVHSHPMQVAHCGLCTAPSKIKLHGVQAAHVMQLFASAADKHTAAISSLQQQAADQADSDAQWQGQSSQGVLPHPLAPSSPSLILLLPPPFHSVFLLLDCLRMQSECTGLFMLKNNEDLAAMVQGIADADRRCFLLLPLLLSCRHLISSCSCGETHHTHSKMPFHLSSTTMQMCAYCCRLSISDITSGLSLLRTF